MGLLISCATPAASCPTEAIFSDCNNWFCVSCSRALISFEAHRRTFEAADPVIAERIGEIIADESHHARYVRQLLDEWAADGWGDEVREAQEATDAREAKAREWAAERLEAERLREEGVV